MTAESRRRRTGEHITTTSLDLNEQLEAGEGLLNNNSGKEYSW